MPRRNILTPAERASLLAFPLDEDELIRYYTLSEHDLSIIGQKRGNHNRLGFAVQLCYLRYPGFALPPDSDPPASLLTIISKQIGIQPDEWSLYAKRPETRREHLQELQALLGLKVLSISHFRRAVHDIAKLAQQTDQGILLAEALVEELRQQQIILPPIDVIERICSEALTRGTRHVYETLTSSLTEQHRQQLDKLLTLREGSKESVLFWLRQPPGPPKPKYILEHLDRLNTIRELGLPDGLDRVIHQNRLLKLAREGGQMTGQHLRDLEQLRRQATLTAIIVDTRATLIDEIIDLHDRFMGSLFSKAKRTHAEQFHQAGKEINDKVRMFSRIGRALLEAKQSGGDPFAAIEAIISWNAFTDSITEAEKLSQHEDFDYLSLIGDGFNQLRRYTPILLESLNLRAAPVARDLFAGIEVLKEMNRKQARKVPNHAPTSFVRKRWQNLVLTDEGIDRRFYELCVMSELRNSLRSGDIWVKDSRQFKDFEDYLLPPERFMVLRERQELGLSVETDCERYLETRLTALEREMALVERLAAADKLPDASISSTGRLKIASLDKAVPDEVETLMQQTYSLLPHLKITDLLLEVDEWTNFTKHFSHLKSGAAVEDKNGVQALLSGIYTLRRNSLR